MILTPATLVGQWQEEMATKFDVRCATSYDALLRQAPLAFWAQPRVIASIATARRPEHRALLAQQQYDLVIVDEAHHLKNRATANWQLVDVLQKGFCSSRPRRPKLAGGIVQPLDPAQTGHLQDRERIPRQLYDERQTAPAGQPRAHA